jgi:hypothetical protein
LADRIEPVEEDPTHEELDYLKEHDVAKNYPKLVGALLYLSTCTRPDLSFAVYQLTRFMSAPRMAHYKALKRVLRYLKGTVNFGLHYTKNKNAFCKLVGFSDADWAGDKTTRKSTTGYVFMICMGAISWKATGQGSVALSSAEAELVALAKTVQHALWLLRLAETMGFNFQPMTINEDNQATIAIVNGDTKSSERTKHIGVKYFFVREEIQDGKIKVKYIETTEQSADIFTKALVGASFQRLRTNLGVRRKF